MTPEEHETAKRLLWEKALLSLLPDPNVTVKRAAELADKVVEEWKRRFEKHSGRGK